MSPCLTLPSPFGLIGIVWRLEAAGARVQRVLLPSAQAARAAASDDATPAPDILLALAERVSRYLRGEPIALSLELVDLSACSAFQARVLLAEYAIPRGRVSSYGLVAQQVGRPGGARAVGHALATNPYALLIPCHRAVRSDGSLGGYQGGLAMKRALLEMEGVPFGPDGRVAAPFYYAGG